MGILKFLSDILKFDTATGQYELLETEHGAPGKNQDQAKHPKEDKSYTITLSLSENISALKTDFRSDISSDLVVRNFLLGTTYASAVLFMNGMCDSDAINDFILRPGMVSTCMTNATKPYSQYALCHVFSVCDAKLVSQYSDIKSAICEGQAVVLISGEEYALVFDVRKYPQRSISTPENEKTVLGPREGFIENMRTNMTLIRRFVQTDDLVCETRVCGSENNMKIGIVYREGVANVTLIEEVKRRIGKARMKKLLSTGTLEQLIENSQLSPLPQMLMTERPDRCAAFLMEGHVVLLCDGSPISAILPVTLFALLSTSEDAYARQAAGTAMRLVRYMGAFISVIIPGIFTAIVMFHQGFLSTEVLNTLIASRKMVFIPIGVELIFLLLVFQLVREAGMRVPGSIGQAIGIIGGLVLGQAAVAANLASSIVLILVALTGLGNFCIPDYSTQLCALYFRIGFVVSGWVGGFLGFTCAFVLFLTYLASLKSFGVPFLSPYAPKTFAKRPLIVRGNAKNNSQNSEDYTNSQCD